MSERHIWNCDCCGTPNDRDADSVPVCWRCGLGKHDADAGEGRGMKDAIELGVAVTAAVVGLLWLALWLLV